MTSVKVAQTLGIKGYLLLHKDKEPRKDQICLCLRHALCSSGCPHDLVNQNYVEWGVTLILLKSRSAVGEVLGETSSPLWIASGVYTDNVLDIEATCVWRTSPTSSCSCSSRQRCRFVPAQATDSNSRTQSHFPPPMSDGWKVSLPPSPPVLLFAINGKICSKDWPPTLRSNMRLAPHAFFLSLVYNSSISRILIVHSFAITVTKSVGTPQVGAKKKEKWRMWKEESNKYEEKWRFWKLSQAAQLFLIVIGLWKVIHVYVLTFLELRDLLYCPRRVQLEH